MLEVSLYVPALTRTVSPGWTGVLASAILQNGCADPPAPAPLSRQLGFMLSTVHVVDAWAAVPPASRQATRTAPDRPDQLAARSRLPGMTQPSRESEAEHENPSPAKGRTAEGLTGQRVPGDEAAD